MNNQVFQPGIDAPVYVSAEYEDGTSITPERGWYMTYLLFNTAGSSDGTLAEGRFSYNATYDYWETTIRLPEEDGHYGLSVGLECIHSQGCLEPEETSDGMAHFFRISADVSKVPHISWFGLDYDRVFPGQTVRAVVNAVFQGTGEVPDEDENWVVRYEVKQLTARGLQGVRGLEGDATYMPSQRTWNIEFRAPEDLGWYQLDAEFGCWPQYGCTAVERSTEKYRSFEIIPETQPEPRDSFDTDDDDDSDQPSVVPVTETDDDEVDEPESTTIKKRYTAPVINTTAPMAPILERDKKYVEQPVIEEEEVIEDILPDMDITSLEGKAANYLAGKEVVKGYPDGEFKPDLPVNRAEAAKFLLRAAEVPVPGMAEDSPFWDVPELTWYGPYVIHAAKLGFIGGYPDGSFRPTDTVNTAEFLKMLMLTFGLKPTIVQKYKDVPQGVWYERYAGLALSHNLFPERSIWTLFPEKEMTRGEVALAIYQVIQKER